MLHFTFIGNKKNFGYYSTEKSDARNLKKAGVTYPQVMNQVKDLANRLVGSYGFSQEEALNLAMEKVTSDLGIPLGVIKASPFPKSEPSEELSKRERDRILYLANKTGYDGTDFNEAQQYLDNYLDNPAEPNSSIVPYNDPLDELSEDVEEYTSQSPIIATGSPERSLLEGTRSMVLSPRGELLGNVYEEEPEDFIDVDVLNEFLLEGSPQRSLLEGAPERMSLLGSPERSLLEGTRSMVLSPRGELLKDTRSIVPSPRGELLGNGYEEEYNPFIDVEVLDDSSKRGYLPGNPERRSLPGSPNYRSRPSRNIIDRNTLQKLQKMPTRESLEKYKDITGGLFNRNPKLIKI